jgi:hypothetical protein
MMNVSVVTNLPPPPVVRPSVYIYSPANNARFVAPTNLTLYARAVETTGVVLTKEFFAGGLQSRRGAEQQPDRGVESEHRTAFRFFAVFDGMGGTASPNRPLIPP